MPIVLVIKYHKIVPSNYRKIKLSSLNRSREGTAQINCVSVCPSVSPAPLKCLYLRNN